MRRYSTYGAAGSFIITVLLTADDAKGFFALRARRKMVCKMCLVAGVLVLLVSPLLRFF